MAKNPQLQVGGQTFDTRPGREAVQSAAPHDSNEFRVRAVLQAALPIERNRWEQEIRERLEMEIERRKARVVSSADLSEVHGMEEAQRFLTEQFIFGEAEPVEGGECE